MRGRDGTYEESQRTARSGGGAIASKLEDQGTRDEAYDPLAAADARSAMHGVTETASPDNVLTERVERRVKIQLGAKQYNQAADGFKAYSKDINGAISKEKKEREGLAGSLSAEQAALENALAARNDAQSSLDKTWSKYHALELRMGAEKALEQGIVLWQKRANDLAAQFKTAQAQADTMRNQLQQAAGLAAASRTSSRQAAATSFPSPAQPKTPIWPWIFFLGGLVSLLAAAWEALRHRILRAKRID